MRRRTKKKSISSRRFMIYITIFALIWLTDYVYTNFVEPHKSSTEIVSESSPTTNSEPQKVEQPKSSQTAPNSNNSNKKASRNASTYRSGWAELPATPKQKEFYTTHHIHEQMRNYTACYSSKHLCPVWVAAPLHTCYKGDAKRSDSFTFDPTISIDIQPSLSRSYGEYTRGHLLGSAERTISREMNKQTFYASNIAPQLQEGFNAQAGVWNNTEKIVDKQICPDTLYIVTGCLFDDYTHPDGRKVKASTTTNKGDGKIVSVPTAYYKAMLRTKRGTTGRSVMECSPEELKCAAIIVPHLSASKYKPSSKDLISIEELEQLSGVEFFANVKSAPKGKPNPSDWGLK